MPEKHPILITGSSGMLGIDLCQELHNDYEIYGIDNRSRASYVPKAKKYCECDITDAKSVSAAVSKFKPEIVIHAAAWTDVDGCELDRSKAYKVNGDGTENIASACKDSGVALMYISTDFVFDGKKRAPYKESDTPRPLSVYAGSKLKGEEAVTKILNKYFILRTSWLYGKSGKNFVDTIIEKARNAKELKVVNDQVGSPTFSKDLAKAIHILLDKAIKGTGSKEQVAGYGIYHVSNSGSVSWYEYARTILKFSGSTAKVVPITSDELARPARRPAMSVLDNSKFIGFTGYRMRDWEPALKEYIAKGRR